MIYPTFESHKLVFDRGAAALPNHHKLNTFTAIFFARLSTILTQPYHVMFLPLSNYLVAKSALNFNAIPELYTLLHSNDIRYKEHRDYILEIIGDGLKTRDDFEVALRSMSFKLMMELYNSRLGDVTTTKRLILIALRNATRIPYAVQLLCSSYGLVGWLLRVAVAMGADDVITLLPTYVEILQNIIRNRTEGAAVDCDCISFVVCHILDELVSLVTSDGLLLAILETVALLFGQSGEFLTDVRIRRLVDCVGDKKCDYYLKYGAKFVQVPEKTENTISYYLTKITLDYLKLQQK